MQIVWNIGVCVLGIYLILCGYAVYEGTIYEVDLSITGLSYNGGLEFNSILFGEYHFDHEIKGLNAPLKIVNLSWVNEAIYNYAPAFVEGYVDTSLYAPPCLLSENQKAPSSYTLFAKRPFLDGDPTASGISGNVCEILEEPGAYPVMDALCGIDQIACMVEDFFIGCVKPIIKPNCSKCFDYNLPRYKSSDGTLPLQQIQDNYAITRNPKFYDLQFKGKAIGICLIPPPTPAPTPSPSPAPTPHPTPAPTPHPSPAPTPHPSPAPTPLPATPAPTPMPNLRPVSGGSALPCAATFAGMTPDGGASSTGTWVSSSNSASQNTAYIGAEEGPPDYVNHYTWWCPCDWCTERDKQLYNPPFEFKDSRENVINFPVNCGVYDDEEGSECVSDGVPRTPANMCSTSYGGFWKVEGYGMLSFCKKPVPPPTPPPPTPAPPYLRPRSGDLALPCAATLADIAPDGGANPSGPWIVSSNLPSRNTALDATGDYIDYYRHYTVFCPCDGCSDRSSNYLEAFLFTDSKGYGINYPVNCGAYDNEAGFECVVDGTPRTLVGMCSTCYYNFWSGKHCNLEGFGLFSFCQPKNRRRAVESVSNPCPSDDIKYFTNAVDNYFSLNEADFEDLLHDKGYLINDENLPIASSITAMGCCNDDCQFPRLSIETCDWQPLLANIHSVNLLNVPSTLNLTILNSVPSQVRYLRITIVEGSVTLIELNGIPYSVFPAYLVSTGDNFVILENVTLPDQLMTLRVEGSGKVTLWIQFISTTLTSLSCGSSLPEVTAGLGSGLIPLTISPLSKIITIQAKDTPWTNNSIDQGLVAIAWHPTQPIYATGYYGSGYSSYFKISNLEANAYSVKGGIVRVTYSPNGTYLLVITFDGLFIFETQKYTQIYSAAMNFSGDADWIDDSLFLLIRLAITAQSNPTLNVFVGFKCSLSLNPVCNFDNLINRDGKNQFDIAIPVQISVFQNNFAFASLKGIKICTIDNYNCSLVTIAKRERVVSPVYIGTNIYFYSSEAPMGLNYCDTVNKKCQIIFSESINSLAYSNGTAVIATASSVQLYQNGLLILSFPISGKLAAFHEKWGLAIGVDSFLLLKKPLLTETNATLSFTAFPFNSTLRVRIQANFQKLTITTFMDIANDTCTGSMKISSSTSRNCSFDFISANFKPIPIALTWDYNRASRRSISSPITAPSPKNTTTIPFTLITNIQSARKNEDACLQSNQCIYSYNFSRLLNPAFNWSVTLTIKNYLCSAKFSSIAINRKSQLIINGLWNYSMEVAECLTILNGSATISNEISKFPIYLVSTLKVRTPFIPTMKSTLGCLNNFLAFPRSEFYTTFPCHVHGMASEGAFQIQDESNPLICHIYAVGVNFSLWTLDSIILQGSFTRRNLNLTLSRGIFRSYSPPLFFQNTTGIYNNSLKNYMYSWNASTFFSSDANVTVKGHNFPARSEIPYFLANFSSNLSSLLLRPFQPWEL